MNTPRKLPALHREEIAAGERIGALDPSELAALRTSNAEILKEHPASAVAAEVKRRVAQQAARTRSPARPLLVFGLPTLAAAAVALLVLFPGDPDPVTPYDVPGLQDMSQGDVRIKGLTAHLVVHRQAGEQAELLRTPARAGAGDVLQVSYVAAGASHGVIVSLDGAGVVTLHYPASADGSTALDQRGAVRLAQSYELDAAPGFERFVFVTATGPIAPAKVMAAAESLGRHKNAATQALELPASWAQSSFLIEKVSP